MEVNGEPVSREKFAAYVTRIAEVIDEIVKRENRIRQYLKLKLQPHFFIFGMRNAIWY